MKKTSDTRSNILRFLSVDMWGDLHRDVAGGLRNRPLQQGSVKQRQTHHADTRDINL